MKKNIILSLLFASGFYFGQTNLSSSENYIYTKKCMDENCNKKSETVQF